jgi:hypothetical protein
MRSSASFMGVDDLVDAGSRHPPIECAARHLKVGKVTGESWADPPTAMRTWSGAPARRCQT